MKIIHASKTDLFENFIAFLLGALVVLVIYLLNDSALVLLFLCIHLRFSSLHLLLVETLQLLQLFLQTLSVPTFNQV